MITSVLFDPFADTNSLWTALSKAECDRDILADECKKKDERIESLLAQYNRVAAELDAMKERARSIDDPDAIGAASFILTGRWV